MKKKQNTSLSPRTGVIYARYSSRNQKEESIEQQVDECMAFAEANNIIVTQVYADKAVSGRTVKRHQFQRMMRDAEKNKFEVVLAYKSNRIARDMIHALNCAARLNNLGIETLYAKEEFGNTAAGRFALRTMMNVNQFYSENLSEDTRRGMLDNAADSKINGPVAYGYKKGADGKYEIDEPAAAVIKEIFARYLADESLADISRSLNERRIKTRLGNAWNRSSYHVILKNVNYIGTYHYMGVTNEDAIPPIIEKDVFYAVQEKIKTQGKVRRRNNKDETYLLTGKLFCGLCKSPMTGVSGTGASGRKYHYYACVKNRADKACPKSNISRDYIEKLVAERTQQIILQDGVIEWIADNAMKYQHIALKNNGLAEAEFELAENKKELREIVNCLKKGIYNDTTQQEMLALEGNIKLLEEEIAITKANNQPLDRERIVFALQQLRDGKASNKRYQKHLIDMLVKAVYLHESTVEIDYHYGSPDVDIKIRNTSKKPHNGADCKMFNLTPRRDAIRALLNFLSNALFIYVIIAFFCKRCESHSLILLLQMHKTKIINFDISHF